MGDTPALPALSAATVGPREVLRDRASSLLRTQAYVLAHARSLGALRVVWLWTHLWTRAAWGVVAGVLLTLGTLGLGFLVGAGVSAVAGAATSWFELGAVVGVVTALAATALLARAVVPLQRQWMVLGRERVLWRVHRHATGCSPYEWPNAPPGVGWRGVTLGFGVLTLMFLPTQVPNLFQLGCEELAREAERGLVDLQRAQQKFEADHQRYGTLPELLQSGVLRGDPNNGATHYRFYVFLQKKGYTALAVDRRKAVNPRYPRDTWLVGPMMEKPQRYEKACKE